jgi:DNA-binding PadR family transcriptional regulator
MYGTEIANLVRKLTGGRVQLGPGTLYSILSTFEAEDVIVRAQQQGRRITYQITEKGEQLYRGELARMNTCLQDAQRDLSLYEEEQEEGAAAAGDLLTNPDAV